MENKLTRPCDLQAAPFGTAVIKTTSAQAKLIEFIKQKAEKQEMINREDICDFYIEHVKGDEYYKVYGQKLNPNPGHNNMITDYDNYTFRKWRDDYYFKSWALQWFKNNLGSCILKGKLLVLPIIDIN